MGNEVESILRELAMMAYEVTVHARIYKGEVSYFVCVDTPPNKHGVSTQITSQEDTVLHIALTKAQAALMVK